MKAITHLAFFAVGSALVGSAFAKTPEGWSTDLEKALEQAKKEKKSVLVEFTGSDWCAPCIAVKKAVLSKKEFTDKASEKFILVELDFPKSDEALAKKNEPIREKYEVEGFPTVLLLTPEGKQFSTFNPAGFMKVDAFLAHLDAELEKKELD
ncbi:thioredoxin family protein [Luteolibacter sp. GHJ8]|jgi:thiol:disulfide interchange protein|uniref:Thioredoxin family protein n=1 Tax=Luteolibacter rhizosphaerae TaxID=2989719 RepID=A0ABT3FZ75_9BACT|nr:thioredoxin family protein [Luteolibacter rhizosphaerae]MCW1912539.1 thioredoxin family protein [Luteolibacter rhizosphaerae]